MLGWVYQYYNTEANAELKRRKNRTTGFKYKPDDIPIANQFYTPHWVVRVLADNTLGRLWLEMQERLPQLESFEEEREGKQHTHYRLSERRRDVPHAAEAPEAFKAWITEEADILHDHTVDRLCRFLVPLPSRPVPRGKKSVREIRVLDPACGSGHFLLYAFDILFAMYREAEPELDPREISTLILEHNLFGIDIDLRAAQLAAFGLYLKARATLAAIDPSAPLRLRRLNIVVADAHIGNDPRKEAFLDRYQGEPEIQELYGKILADLDHTNVLGSLLKVRTEFERFFGRVSEAAWEQARKQRDIWYPTGQQELFSLSTQQELREVFEARSGREWTIDELLDDLRRFEEEVLPSQDIGARLFYTDLERTVGLLGLLSRQYDIVLMNPPYGDMPPEAKDYLKGNSKKKIPAHYPRTHGDLYAAFMEQAIDLTHSNGFVGALVPWTYTFLSTLEKVRTEILCGEARPEFIQEYGYGILDGATVGTVVTVARKLSGARAGSVLEHPCVFDRLSEQKKDWQKQEKFLGTFPEFAAAGPNHELGWFVARLGSLKDVPGMPYAYWASDSLRRLFRLLPALDHDNSAFLPGRPVQNRWKAREGHTTGDNSKYIRLPWEVNLDNKAFIQYEKGEHESNFYPEARFALHDDWQFSRLSSDPTATVRNREYQGKAPVAWRYIGWKTRRFVFHNDTVAFDHASKVIVCTGIEAPLVCGVLNSGLHAAMTSMLTVERKWEVGLISSLPIPLNIDSTAFAKISNLSNSLRSIKKSRYISDETCRDFVAPELLQLFRKQREINSAAQLDIASLLSAWLTEREAIAEEEARLLRELDEEVYRLYEISPDDRALIERELARRPKSEAGYSAAELTNTNSEIVASDVEGSDDVDQIEDDADTENADGEAEASGEVPTEVTPDRARDLVARFVSYYLKQTLEADQDGIVPVAPTHGEPGLIIRLRETMMCDLGETAAQALETQAPAYLGTEDLAEWLALSKEETREVDGKKQKFPLGFFPWHGTLYRNRPIFWLISSENFEKGKTRFTFRAFLHYLKLTPDTLPRLMAYYLDPVLDWANGEWNRARDEATRLEGRAQRVANAAAQEWLNTVDALKRFRTALEGMIQGPPRAEKVPENAKWLPRTIAQVHGGQDLGHGYQPDIDYGVRVNITSLVEAKLLPKVVLKRLGG